MDYDRSKFNVIKRRRSYIEFLPVLLVQNILYRWRRLKKKSNLHFQGENDGEPCLGMLGLRSPLLPRGHSHMQVRRGKLHIFGGIEL